MRLIERLPILYKELIDNNKIRSVLDFLFKNVFDSRELDMAAEYILKEAEKIMQYHFTMPDLRFTQVLTNYGIVGNAPGFWYYTEDSDILIFLKLKPEHFLYWYIPSKNPARNPVCRKLSDLTKDQLETILEQEQTYDSLYIKTIKKLLKSLNNK